MLLIYNCPVIIENNSKVPWTDQSRYCLAYIITETQAILTVGSTWLNCLSVCLLFPWQRDTSCCYSSRGVELAVHTIREISREWSHNYVKQNNNKIVPFVLVTIPTFCTNKRAFVPMCFLCKILINLSLFKSVQI